MYNTKVFLVKICLKEDFQEDLIPKLKLLNKGDILRIYSILEFPQNSVYILLEDNFRKQLFNKVIKTVGSFKALGRELDVSAVMIKNWYNATNKLLNGEECIQCMPLWAVNKILKILPKKNFFSCKIDKHVIRYQAKGGSPVNNPKLPLIEDERLIRIFFHLAGDGYGGEYGGSIPYYYNTNTFVRNEFIKDLSVFGDVKLNFQENLKRIYFPKVIAHIIKHIYKTNFLSNKVRIPRSFFYLDSKILLQGIKALADDEGHVDSYKIKISSMNKLFLKDILKLLELKCPELAKYVSIIGHGDYKLNFLSKGMRLYSRLINFMHNEKRKDLKFYLKLKNRKYEPVGKTKLKILQSLNKKEKTIKCLSYDIKAYPTMIEKHIRGYKLSDYYIFGLKELHLVKSVKDKSGKHIWRITEKGKKVIKTKIFPKLSYKN
ncbi:MAG: hypothetical protein ACE5J4_02115 [Candidatus Aenigmatarchaeota archaeon]